MSTFTPEMILEVARVFHWAEMLDFVEYLTGERKRLKAVENHLPDLVRKRKLKRLSHGKKYVYAVTPDKTRHKANIKHGLVCTRALLRIKASSEVEFVPEAYFRRCGFGVVPEWASIHEETITLFEYSTADNFRRRRLMNKKLADYRESLEVFARHFEKRPLVLFVFDAPDYAIRHFLNGKSGLQSFYFADYESFIGVEKSKQLEAPIYTWGGDLEKYSLVKS